MPKIGDEKRVFGLKTIRDDKHPNHYISLASSFVIIKIFKIIFSNI